MFNQVNKTFKNEFFNISAACFEILDSVKIRSRLIDRI